MTDPTPSTTSSQYLVHLRRRAGISLLTVAGIFIIILLSIFVPYLLASWSVRPDKTLLRELTEAEAARGLITFLVAVSTVAIAFLLIVFISSAEETAANDLKDRFAFSKEILTSLVGILGTIIGFYFGATGQTQTQGHGAPKPLTLANLSITPPKPGKGDTVMLHATLSDGKLPYSYAIEFTPDTIKAISGTSSDGAINQAIKLEAYDPAKPLDITLRGKDDAGSSATDRWHLAATAQGQTQIHRPTAAPSHAPQHRAAR
jgi:hypothetical protein